MEEVAKRPFFSIIIPVYNVAPYLRECLDSVLAQTFSDWEAICVDDGSTDSSGTILDEYAAKDKRFRVFHQKNKGVSIARNFAIEKANGEFIGFMDPDDAIDNDWLYHANVSLRDLALDVVRFEMQRWRGNSRVAVQWDGRHLLLNNKKDLIEWGWKKYLSNNCGGVWSVFAKSALIKDAIFFPAGMRMKEDRIFLLRTLMNTHKMACYDYAGYFYRKRNDGACGSKRSVSDAIRYMDELRTIIDEYREEMEQFASRILLRRVITETIAYDILELLESGNVNEWRINHEIPKRITAFWKAGFFGLQYVYPRYMFAFLWARLFGNMNGFWIIRRIVFGVRMIRKVLYIRTLLLV